MQVGGAGTKPKLPECYQVGDSFIEDHTQTQRSSGLEDNKGSRYRILEPTSSSPARLETEA